MRRKATVAVDARQLYDLLKMSGDLAATQHALENAGDTEVELKIDVPKSSADPTGVHYIKHVLPKGYVAAVLRERIAAIKKAALALGVVLR